LVESAVELFRGQVAINVLPEHGLSFGGNFKPFHAHAGQRVFNFSLALCPCAIQSRYGHLNTPFILHSNGGRVDKSVRPAVVEPQPMIRGFGEKWALIAPFGRAECHSAHI
jgi:hypothetical protein